MSRIRLLAVLCLAAAPGVVQAQQQKQFEDSWFWGVKGGGLLYSTTRVENQFAPSAGIEWVITRSRAALYISYDRAFFTADAAVADPLSVTGLHDVSVQDVQRVSFGAFVYPKRYGWARPYGGLGFAMHLIGSTAPGGTYGSSNEQLTVESTVEDQRSQASPIAVLGLQGASPRWTLFVQAVAAPVKGFLLNEHGLVGVEAGLRYNIGSAIERIR